MPPGGRLPGVSVVTEEKVSRPSHQGERMIMKILRMSGENFEGNRFPVYGSQDLLA
jgi:hypothetical protein